MDRHWEAQGDKSSHLSSGGDVASLVDALVASSHDDFVKKSVRLATDTAWRAAVSTRICATAGVLFEDMSSVQELESLLLRLARLHAE